jgi:hypothetical protein
VVDRDERTATGGSKGGSPGDPAMMQAARMSVWLGSVAGWN